MEEYKLSELKDKFLIESTETGRFIVKSPKTGKTYFVECIDGDEKSVWGDYDPAEKKFQTSNYGKKHKGSITKDESIITKENGFTKIHDLGIGESPLAYINKIDEEYYSQQNK